MDKARIRQQGFDDHAGGYEIYDNPFKKVLYTTIYGMKDGV
jgi:hypothetical protein